MSLTQRSRDKSSSVFNKDQLERLQKICKIPSFFEAVESIAQKNRGNMKAIGDRMSFKKRKRILNKLEGQTKRLLVTLGTTPDNDPVSSDSKEALVLGYKSPPELALANISA